MQRPSFPFVEQIGTAPQCVPDDGLLVDFGDAVEHHVRQDKVVVGSFQQVHRAVVAKGVHGGSSDRTGLIICRMDEERVRPTVVAFTVLPDMRNHGYREANELLLGDHLHVFRDAVVPAKEFADVVRLEPRGHHHGHPRELVADPVFPP